MRLEQATPKKNVIIAIIMFVIGSILGLLGIFGVLEFKDIFQYIEMMKDGSINIEEVVKKLQEIGDPIQAIGYIIGTIISFLGGIGQFFAVNKK